MRTHPLVVIALSVSTLAGCLSPETVEQPTPSPTVPTQTVNVSIYDLQDTSSTFHPVVGTHVSVFEAVVTAIVVDEERRNFFISDPDGGLYSGIYVYDIDGTTPAEIEVGNLVDVYGTYEEISGVSQITFTAFDNISITPHTGVLPVYALDGADLAAIATEELEGVLVSVAGVNVDDPAYTAFGEFTLTNGTDTVIADDFVYADAEICRFRGQPLTTITGVVHYTFGDYKLEPRDDLDIELADPDYISIYGMQDTSNPCASSPSDAVSVGPVVVTAVYEPVGMEHSFFVADPNGGPFSGVRVFDDTNIAPANLVIGDEVLVTGIHAETAGRTEISLTGGGASVTVTGNTLTPPVSLIDALDLADIATGGAKAEDYEGVLIEIVVDQTPVTVATNPAGGEFNVTNGTDLLLVGDAIYNDADLGVSMGQDVTTLRGILDFSTSEFKLEPREPNDINTQ